MESMRKSPWIVVLLGFIMITGTLSLTPIVSCVDSSETTNSASYSIMGCVYLYDGFSAIGYLPLLSNGGATVDVTWWNTSSGSWDTIVAPTNGLGEYNANIDDYNDGEVVYLNATFDAPYGNVGYNYTYINSTAGSSEENVVCGVPYNITITNPLPMALVIGGVPFQADWKITDIGGVLCQGYFTWDANPFSWLAEDPVFIPPPATTWDGTATVPGPGIVGPGIGQDFLTLCFGPTCWINITEDGAELPSPDNFLTPWGEFYIDPFNTIPGFLKDYDEITLNLPSGFFCWELVQGWNLVSAPRKPVGYGTNGIFDADDALNHCFDYTLDPNMFMLARTGGNPSAYVRNDYGIGEAGAFEIDNVHAYWVYCSIPPQLSGIIIFNSTDWTNPGYITVNLDVGWNLLGFPHNFTIPGWNVLPTASMFTDGTIDPDLDIALGLTKIVVTEWDQVNQWYNSYVVKDVFPGMPFHNWQWDFSYSPQPGNGFFLWVDQPVTLDFPTTFGGEPGNNPMGAGGSPQPTLQCPPPTTTSSMSSPSDDPYPIYGYVLEDVGGIPEVLPGADVFVEWSNKTGTVIDAPGAYPVVSNVNGQYSVDMLDYMMASTVWANATKVGYNGYNLTTVDNPPMGGEQLDIFEDTDFPDIWINPTSFDFVVNKGDTDSQILTIGNNGTDELSYSIIWGGLSNLIFSDDFDGEVEGTSPPVNWVESGINPPQNCEVDDVHSYSSPHSMWLRSSAGGSGTVHHDVSFTSEWYQLMLYFDSTNQRRNIVTQAVPGDLVGTEYCVYMQFDELGRIRYYDGAWKLTGFSYSTGWHKLEIAHDFTNKTFDAWYDGIQILNNYGFWHQSKTSIESIHIWVVSTGGDLWVDNVQIGTPDPVDWLSVAPDNGTLLPSTNTTHTVWVNTTGLAPGFYQANITIQSNDPDEDTIIIPVNLTVINITQPEMGINKWAPATANPGETITYWLNYSNVGSDWAYNVVITETYPPGVTFISSTPFPDIGNNVWLVGDLAPGATGSIEITVQVDMAASGVLTNWVSVDYENSTGVLQPTVNSWANTTIISPYMVITKTGPPIASVGQDITYNIFFQNVGNTTAYNVWVNDTLPADVTYVTAVPLPTVIALPLLTWDIGTLAPGEFGIITITVNVNVGATWLNNSVIVNYTSDPPGTVPYNNTAYAITFVEGPILIIDKYAPATANTGEIIAYVINVTNVGNGPATNVEITENYPPGLTFLSSISNPVADWTVGNNVWGYFVILSGQTVTITVLLQVDNTTSGILLNSVYVDYENLVGVAFPSEWAFAQTLIIDPLLTITKDAPATANTGEQITYTLTVTNVGTDTAYDVVVTENYPPGVTFVSAIPPPDVGNNVWNLGNMSPGTSIIISIDVLVTATGGWLNNTAYVDYNNGARPMVREWAFWTTLIINPDVSITKWAPTTANTGETITYWLNHTNNGNDWAYNLVITETYPAGVTFISAIPAPSIPDNIWDGSTVPSLAALAPGASDSIQITVLVDPLVPLGTILVNNVTVDYENGAGGPYQNWASANTLVIGPLMEVAKDAPPYANATDIISYMIYYWNNGTDWAYNVVITETYPPGVIFLSAIPPATIGNDIWIIPAIAPGGSGSIQITVQINIGFTGILVNHVDLNYENGAGMSYPTIWAEAITVVGGTPIIDIWKSAPPTANSGEIIMYTITYQNLGNNTAFNVVITETYPLGVIFLDANPPPSFGNNIWDGSTIPALAVLPPGAGGTIFINVTVTGQVYGILTNIVQVDYEDSAGGAQPTQWASADTMVIDPLMLITKTGPATANPGELINYTIMYQNLGNDTAYNVVITDLYPAGVTFVAAVPAPSVGNNVWMIGNLAPGTFGVITITVQVNPGAMGMLNNSVTVDYESSAGVPYQDWATTVTIVIGPSMVMTKDAPATASPGDLITYWINYSNIGTDWAYNVLITETYPANVTFVSATPIPDIPMNIWIVGSLAPGAGGSIQNTEMVNPGTPVGTWLNNTVTLDYENGAGIPQPPVITTAWTLVVGQDTDPPDHSNESPGINGFTSDPTPVISVHVTDPSGVNASTIRFFIDGFMVFYDLVGIPNGYNVSYWHGGGFFDGQVVECRIVADDMLGYTLDFTWYFTVDLTPPGIIWTDPGGGQVDVPLDYNVTVGFSESMNKYWTEQAFNISPYVVGTFLWSDNMTMIFNPAGFQLNTTYTVIISVLARDVAGNNMLADYTWNFTTDATDVFPPEHSNEFPPIDGYTATLDPRISVHVTDVSGVNTSTIKFYICGFRIFHDLASIPNGYNVSYWHESGFSPGEVVTCRIMAQDFLGNQLDFTWSFTVLSTFDIDLHLGWNLISFPLVPVNTSIESVLSSIDGYWDIVNYYDAWDTTDHWKSYSPYKPPSLNDLWDLNNTMGFWLHVTNVSTLTVQGLEPGITMIPLKAGWNMVGYPSFVQKTVAEALMGTGYDAIEGYDENSPYLKSALNDTYMMTPGEGYLVHVPSDTIWVVDW